MLQAAPSSLKWYIPGALLNTLCSLISNIHLYSSSLPLQAFPFGLGFLFWGFLTLPFFAG
jgi:hypothetical protein